MTPSRTRDYLSTSWMVLLAPGSISTILRSTGLCSGYLNQAGVLVQTEPCSLERAIFWIACGSHHQTCDCAINRPVQLNFPLLLLAEVLPQAGRNTMRFSC